MVPEFPARAAGAPEAQSAGGGDRSRARERRAAWSAAWAVGDAVARWWLMYGFDGHGLRGGTFTTTGEYLAYTPVRFRLRDSRFVSDVPVSGNVTWNRRRGRVTRAPAPGRGGERPAAPRLVAERDPRGGLAARAPGRPAGRAEHARALEGLPM